MQVVEYVFALAPSAIELVGEVTGACFDTVTRAPAERHDQIWSEYMALATLYEQLLKNKGQAIMKADAIAKALRFTSGLMLAFGRLGDHEPETKANEDARALGHLLMIFVEQGVQQDPKFEQRMDLLGFGLPSNVKPIF